MRLPSVIVALIALSGLSACQQEEISFNQHIRPILNKNCITCHGGVKQAAEFSVLFREDALEPAESGKHPILPGDPSHSELIARITSDDPEYRMPAEADPLSKEEVRLLREWIKQGAKWEEHWAYIKPKAIDPPDLNSDWGNNQIDAFTLAKMEDRGLRPSPQADKATLLRRVSLDLTGLPPTTESLEGFLSDDSPQAFEKIVDQLLQSPSFGEHWATMWLDLARYADSEGYEKDGYRNIWRYRDWVIKAFNQDMPFDQFTIEQLAGDLLPNPTEDQRIATAFHRNTMENDEGGTEDEEFRIVGVIDRVNTTWETWQGTSMACVQCHSHPYDPIRQEEYYEFFAFLNNTADGDYFHGSPKWKMFEQEDQSKYQELISWASNLPLEDKSNKVKVLEHLLRIGEPKIHAPEIDIIQNTRFNDVDIMLVDNGSVFRINQLDLTNKAHLILRYGAGKIGPDAVIEIYQDSIAGPLIGRTTVNNTEGFWNHKSHWIDIQADPGSHDLYFKVTHPSKELDVIWVQWVLPVDQLPGQEHPAFDDFKSEVKHLVNTNGQETPILVELPPDYQRTTNLLVRGNWQDKGQAVTPGVPDVWNPLPEGRTRNRMTMANWLVDMDNPLTARVAVNRFWAALFGRGIVETLEDFGTQGTPPTHPELLDWLALRFMEQHQWSLKKLLKQMVLSATYQQNAKVSPEQLEQDPKNLWWARGPKYRLSSEQLRDQALAVSGLLSKKMYGKSVMPPQPEGVWQVVYSGSTWETSDGEDRYRRGVYTYIRRTSPYPSLTTFDGPSREVCTNRRLNTNTPLQALVTLNDPVFLEAAQALAKEMKATGNQTNKRIQEGYYRALQQNISPNDEKSLMALYESSLNHYNNTPEDCKKLVGSTDIQLAALTVVANAIMNLDEFLNRT
ncbi:MAG: DUF1553 domain-containing protein [Cyclobacteriaceae bacterium]